MTAPSLVVTLELALCVANKTGTYCIVYCVCKAFLDGTKDRRRCKR